MLNLVIPGCSRDTMYLLFSPVYHVHLFTYALLISHARTYTSGKCTKSHSVLLITHDLDSILHLFFPIVVNHLCYCYR